MGSVTPWTEVVVLGLDFGTKLGWAIGKGGKILRHGAIDLKKRAEHLRRPDGPIHVATAMYQEARSLIKDNEVGAVCHENSEASFRGAAAGGMGVLDRATASHTRYGAVIDILIDAYRLREIDPVMPRSLKKFATDSGDATKEQMIAAARRFYEIEVEDDNAADACHVCAYAMNTLRVEQLTGRLSI